MVWGLVVVLLVLVALVLSLDYCMQLYILVCYDQKWTDSGRPVNIRI
jgi:hypothetical protein